MRCSVFQLGTLWQEVRCIVVRSAVMCISVGYSAVSSAGNCDEKCGAVYFSWVQLGGQFATRWADRPLRAGIGQSEPAARRTGAREGLRDRNRQENRQEQPCC